MTASHEGDDEGLVARANAGDEEAFAILYRRHREWVLALATRFTGEGNLAQDVVQEAFLWLLGKFPGLELRGRLTTLLYPVVKHLALRARERAGRYGRALEDAPEATVEGEAQGTRAALEAALRILPEPQREVLLMRYADDLSPAEIALALGIPEGTAKSRLHAAVAALRADPRTRGHFGI